MMKIFDDLNYFDYFDYFFLISDNSIQCIMCLNSFIYHLALLFCIT